MAYDPAEALEAIVGSVLAITGAKDIQVDPDDVARIGRIVTGRFDGEVPTDLTHILRRDPGPPSLRARTARSSGDRSTHGSSIGSPTGPDRFWAD